MPCTEPTANVSRWGQTGSSLPQGEKPRTPARALAAQTGLEVPVRVNGKKETKGIDLERK